MYSKPNDGASHEAADPRYNDPQQGVLQKNPTWAGPKPRQDGHTKQQPPQHGATAYHHARRPEQAQKAGEHTPAHRGHPPRTPRQAQLTNHWTRRPSQTTRESTQSQRAGRRTHTPPPQHPQAADNLQQGKQAPHQQQQPRTAQKPPAADAPPPPPNEEPPRQELPFPQSTPGKQTYYVPIKQGQREHLPNPPQEPPQAPRQGEKASRKPPASPKGGSHPSKKTEGASARGASQLAATWPSAPHRKQMRVWS
ncbi:acidic proline-rich protein PRP25-like [Procambarus clarkii]|uniref:acidic proline-rich protein PRP25-like n=1 Tax=Procambarus clarkii TaxID=6728 RepID=UPI0037437A0C